MRRVPARLRTLLLALLAIAGCATKGLPPEPGPVSPLPSTTSPTASQTATATAISTSCSDNLIACSNPTAMFVKDESWSSAKLVEPSSLQVSFKNFRNGSGVALQLTRDLDVGEFRFVEVEGSSSQEFSFTVQYKQSGQQTPIVESGPGIFPKAPVPRAERVPLEFDGSVGQVVVNFFRLGESSDLAITAIRLVE